MSLLGGPSENISEDVIPDDLSIQAYALIGTVLPGFTPPKNTSKKQKIKVASVFGELIFDSDRQSRDYTYRLFNKEGTIFVTLDLKTYEVKYIEINPITGKRLVFGNSDTSPFGKTADLTLIVAAFARKVLDLEARLASMEQSPSATK